MECNPFHQGHQYIIDQAARIAGKASDCASSDQAPAHAADHAPAHAADPAPAHAADHAPAHAADHAPERGSYVIVVMSGNFVQRGTPAVVPKEIRTRKILEAGADLVLELPVRWAASSAEFFARGGIDLLLRTGIVTDLVFGSESGDVRKLISDAQFLCREPADYRSLLKGKISSGMPFPAARAAAAAECSAHIHLPDSANDVLAEEYLKELIRCGKLSPVRERDEASAAIFDADAGISTGSPNHISPTASHSPDQICPIAQHTPDHTSPIAPHSPDYTSPTAPLSPDQICQITPHAIRRISAPTASEIRAEMKSRQSSEALFEDDFSPLLLEKLLLIDSGRFCLYRSNAEEEGRSRFDLCSSAGGSGSANSEKAGSSRFDLCSSTAGSGSANSEKADRSSVLSRSRLHAGPAIPVHFQDYAGVTPDLANRIHNLLPQFVSWTQFASLLKTRNLTSTAVNRALLHILLDVTKDLMPAETAPGCLPDCPAERGTSGSAGEKEGGSASRGADIYSDPSLNAPYARVLGFRKESAFLIGKIRENGLPLITSHADYAAFVSRKEEELREEFPDTRENVFREETRHFPGRASSESTTSPEKKAPSENKKERETADIALRSLQLDYAASECYDLVKRMKKSRQEDDFSGLPVGRVSEFSKPPVII